MTIHNLKARPSTVFYLTISLFLIVVFYFLTYQLLTHAPLVIKLDQLEIKPEQAPLTIGSNELAQKEGVRSGERQHLRLIYDAQTGWQVANIAKYKHLDAPGGNYKTRYLPRFLLQSGDSLSIKGQVFKVLTTEGQLQLQHVASQQQISWQNGQSGRLTQDDTVCSEDDKTIKNWLYPKKIAVLDWFSSKKEESLLFKIGGSVTCARRWGILANDKALLAADSARIYWLDQHYWFAPGVGRQNLLRIKRQNQLQWLGLDQIYTPIADKQAPLENLVIGRSTYKVTVSSDHSLRFNQLSGDVWLETDWQEHLKNLPPLQLETRMTEPKPFADTVPLWVHSLYLLSFISSISLALRKRLGSDSGLLWVLSLALLFAGNLVLLQLAIGGINERFLNLATTFLKVSVIYQLAVLGIAFLPLTLIRQGITVLFRVKSAHETDRSAYPNYLSYLKVHSHELSFYLNSALNLAVCGYFVMLAMQAVGGLETGVSGYQPVEFSKFIIVLVSSISAVEYYEKRYLAAYDHHGSIWWSLQQTFWLFSGLSLIVAFTAVMLGIVRDFSPIVLIFLYLLLFSFRILAHPVDGSFNHLSKIIAVLLIGVMCIPAYLLLSTKITGTPPGLLMNADRFQVWANPSLYPHSGSQVIDSMSLISNSKALGQEDWFARNSSEVMQLPAVQDDFIATFLIHHFGYLSALGLLSIQLLLVWQLSHTAATILQDKNFQRSMLERQMAYSGSLFCFGFAGLLIAHWLISWSNVLGLLPVMGQPMAMLSSGGSNLLLFVVPCFLLCFCFAWIKEAQ